MDPIELGIAIAPEELLGAMVEQCSVEDITTFVLALPQHLKDKKFVQEDIYDMYDMYDMYGKVLKIYEEAGK